MPSDKMKIGSVTLVPNPPVSGQTLNAKANFTLSKQAEYAQILRVEEVAIRT